MRVAAESQKRALRIAVGVLALLAIGLGFFRWYTSPERRIRGQLDRVQELISKAPAESNLTAMAKVRSAGDLFAGQFEFIAEPFNFHTRDRQQLISGILQYRSRAQTILMQLPEVDISVGSESRRATSHVTTVFITKARDLAGREAYRFQINWILEEGEWRMDYVRLLEVIEEPPRSWIP